MVNHPQVGKVQVVGTRTKEVGTRIKVMGIRTKVLAQVVLAQGQMEARTQMAEDNHPLGRLATQVLASNRTTKVALQISLVGMATKVSQMVEVEVLG